MAKIKPIWEGYAEDWPLGGEFGNHAVIIRAFPKKTWISLEKEENKYFLKCNAQKRETCQ